jgi:hypothetical protein
MCCLQCYCNIISYSSAINTFALKINIKIEQKISSQNIRNILNLHISFSFLYWSIFIHSP